MNNRHHIDKVRRYLLGFRWTSHWMFIGLTLGICLLLAWGIKTCKGRPTEPPSVQIVAEDYTLPDTLRVITLSGATTYYEYKGEAMGYQYELLKSYAESRSLPYIITVASSKEEVYSALSQGTHHLSITPEVIGALDSTSTLLYTGAEELDALVLVQRKSSKTPPSSTPFIHNVTELMGQSIYAIRGGREEARLRRLEEQLGGAIDLISVEQDSLSSEELIGMVSERQIDYLCCDGELAGIATTYYRNLDISTVLSFPQRLRWVGSARQRGLMADIDRWSVGGQGQKVHSSVHRKYFAQSKTPSFGDALSDQELASLPKGKLSPYDDIFRTQAKRTPWKWPLLAAIAYHESRFDADVIGWSGARGLMGIMPRTGRIFGVEKDELLDPKTSVRISVDCLMNVYELYSDVKDPTQRLKLTLASYNAGQGHIQDAQRLAEKYGADPLRWDGHVGEYILQKSKKKYYQDPVCRYGYLRGKETYNYVADVYSRYQHYLSKVSK